ncbi:maltotransferase domain-containing protein, partial [Streptomyces sp. NPDC001508]|uniref:maltotransferase domain-containing protein n=1 Tax=Streptomyces sp. NPDC001508 TaxID=3154656 RepID=UPI00332E83E6
MPARHPSSPPPTSSRSGTTAGPPERTADAVAPAGRGEAGPPCRERSPVSGDTAVGRIPVLDVRPVVLGGRRPAKAVVGETFEVSATVFREGHDAVAANVVLCDP